MQCGRIRTTVASLTNREGAPEQSPRSSRRERGNVRNLRCIHAKGGRALKLITTGMLLLLAGCWNENVATNVRMGDVSIGQQLMDLARALEEGAIDADEHARLKAGLMSLSELCGKQREG